jgi:hypothetical protein
MHLLRKLSTSTGRLKNSAGRPALSINFNTMKRDMILQQGLRDYHHTNKLFYF